ncbi:hypothetical protein ScPMuIL_002952 [Solemya velum]
MREWPACCKARGKDFTSIETDSPKFPDCLQQTLLVWVPCGWLWVSLPFYTLFFISKPETGTLPHSALNITKTILSICLFCLTLVSQLIEEHDGYNCTSREIPPAHYLATGLKAMTFLLATVLMQVQRVKGEISSGVLFLFWLLQLLCAIIPLESKIVNQAGCTESILYYIFFACLCVEFFLHCFAEKHRPRHTQGYREIVKPPCPEDQSGVLSQFTFWWFTSLVVTAYRKTLGPDDIWDQTPKLKSDTVVPPLEEAWEREQKACFSYKNGQTQTYSNFEHDSPDDETTPLISSNGHVPYKGIAFEKNKLLGNQNKPSLYRVLFRSYIVTWLKAVGYKVVSDGFWFLQPFIIGYLIALIEDKNTQYHPAWQGIILSVALFVGDILSSFFYHVSYHVTMNLGLSIKTALLGLIYRKSLTMTHAAKKSTAVGDIVNLMSVDCQRIQDGFTFSYFIVSFFVMVGLGIYQLWNLMGISALGALGAIVILTPVMGILGLMQEKIQNRILKLKGSRINLLNQVIGGIKVLKMYTWEKTFEKKVFDLRSEELKCLHKIANLNATSLSIAVHCPFVMLYCTILIYVLMSPDHFIDAQKVFTALSLVNILRFPVALTPFVISGLIQAYVSVGRIQRFLWNEDLDPNNVEFVMKADYAISVDNGIFTWDKQSYKPTLYGLNLKVKEGQLIAVVGRVGSGKSSFISALLGEMHKIQGHVSMKGQLAYVPQEAWIQNMTLRDNILYGKDLVEKKYRRVLQMCALLPDLQILDGGDMTEIGEKGINISGGQKQRVSLARAVYSNADVYLMDDPLSAVDSHVGKDLFKNVIGNEGLLKHKTRILVTHGVHWLPMVDTIIVLKEGAISEMGSYQELLSHSGSFAQFLQEYLIHVESSDEGDPEIQKIRDKMWQQVECATSEGVTSDDNQDIMAARKRRRSRRASGLRESIGHESISRSISKEMGAQKPQPPTETSSFSRLIEDETAQIGSVNIRVFVAFAKAMGIVVAILVFVFMTLFQGLNVYSNYWLTYWTEDPYLKNQSLTNTTTYEEKFITYLSVYTVLGIAQGVFIFFFAYLALNGIVKASGYLHQSMLRCILRSPMSFFDTTPVGRMMNRFSSDIDIIDTNLPLTFRLWMIMVFNLVSVIIVVSVNTPIFLAVIVPVSLIYFVMLRFYLPTARQVKRMESVTRSPIYNHFSETISGASVIRAFRSVDRFVDESRIRVDKNCTFFFAANTAARWISVRLETLGALLIFVAAIFAMITPDLNGAEVGLSVTYAMQITIAMNLVVQSVSDMEMNIVSAERVEEYTELKSEAEWIYPGHRPLPHWPFSGTVEFKNYITRYRPGLDLVLRGIKCTISNGEKVGIVGRTGAGKSSLTLSLFRLIEPAGGEILIDGTNITNMGLHDLRSKITILPQDPVIFSGSLRMNLDPLENYSDSELWKVLETAHLMPFIKENPQRLDYECGEGGHNLSVGERQLVCLARALLHKTKILILDEATAAVDMETDDLIQQTIRREFSDCTILTIAHRLKTVMDYDRVMVLDKGMIVEFASPATLLKNSQGVFYGMAKDANLVSK